MVSIRVARTRPKSAENPAVAAILLRTLSKHRLEYAVGRAVSVGEGLDVDDHLLAHVDAALDSCRAHMRQQHDIVELEQLGADRRLMLEHVEPGAGQLMVHQHA